MKGCLLWQDRLICFLAIRVLLCW